MAQQRTFQRFDIITVLEFKLQSALAGVYAGITRNFSYEGFCLETQCVDFEPGDSLELRLKHPHRDMAITFPAYVVWKKTADKFAYLMGIKVKDAELDTRLSMLEIMSAAGDVPVDSFLSGGGEQETEYHEETEAPAIDSVQTKSSQPAPVQTGASDEDAGPEDFEDEGLLSTEKDILAGKESGYLFDDVLKAAQNEGQEVDLPEPDVESDMPWPKVHAPEKAAVLIPGFSIGALKQFLGNRMFLYSAVAAVIIGISVFAIILILPSSDNSIKSDAPAQAPFPEQTALQQKEEHTPAVLPNQKDADTDAAAPLIPQPIEQPVSDAAGSKPIEPEVPAFIPKPAPADVRASVNQTRYIQVGAWGNPDNARDMLQKIQKYYPDAYLKAGKKLNRVKIPAASQAQVNSILKDIEDKFQIKALVSSER